MNQTSSPHLRAGVLDVLKPTMRGIVSIVEMMFLRITIVPIVGIVKLNAGWLSMLVKLNGLCLQESVSIKLRLWLQMQFDQYVLSVGVQ